MKSQRQWSISKVTKACRSAPAVWLALEQLAAEKGTHVVCPKRKLLCKLGGIRDVKTITLALNTLEESGWLNRGHFEAYRDDGSRVTLLKLVLLYKTQKTGAIGAPSIRPKKRIKVKTRKTGANSPTERGELNASALSLSVGAKTTRPVPYCEPLPIVAKQSVDKETHSGGAKS